MNAAYSLGSTSGAWFASVFFGAIGVGLGWAVTHSIARRQATADGFPTLGTTPLARRVIGALVALCWLVPVWSWLWSGYYAVELRGDSVVLSYLAPRRERSVPATRIADARWVPAPKWTRYLQLRTTDDRVYRSAQVSASKAQRDSVIRLIRGDIAAAAQRFEAGLATDR